MRRIVSQSSPGWDEDVLRLEFEELLQIDEDIGIELSGFEMVEIDRILTQDPAVQEEVVPLPDTARAAVTKLGDLWILGSHRLACGNALEEDSFNAVLRGELAQMVATDPPFNVRTSGHICGLGRVQHREFAMAAGEMSDQEFTGFLQQLLTLATRFSVAAALFYCFMDWRHIRNLIEAGQLSDLELKNICVWVKTNAGMGTLYRSQHEMVAVFKNGPGKHCNNFGLGDGGRYRTNVWQAPGVNTFRPGRMKDLEAHPTCKPTSLYVDMMLDCSKRKGIIMDPFAGSGTVFLAAERTGRQGRGIELDPGYCDVGIRRWQEVTGKDAVHAVSGVTFNDLASRTTGDAAAPAMDQEGGAHVEG